MWRISISWFIWFKKIEILKNEWIITLIGLNVVFNNRNVRQKITERSERFVKTQLNSKHDKHAKYVHSAQLPLRGHTALIVSGPDQTSQMIDQYNSEVFDKAFLDSLNGLIDAAEHRQVQRLKQFHRDTVFHLCTNMPLCFCERVMDILDIGSTFDSCVFTSGNGMVLVENRIARVF